MAAIQSAIGTSATTTVSATFGSAPTSGSLLVAGVMNTDNFATTPTGWTLPAGGQRGDFGGIQLYYKVSDGTETTLTVTLGGAGSGSALMMTEWAHDGTTSGLLDKVASAGSGTSNVSSQATGTTATTTRAAELAIACVGWGGGTNANTPSWSNTWTNSFAQAGTPAARQACALTLAYRDLSATGAYTTTEGVSVANKMQGIIATFKTNAPSGGTDATANAGVAGSASTANAATATGGAGVTAGVAAVATTARAATATGGAAVTAGVAALGTAAYAATAGGGALAPAGVAAAATTAYAPAATGTATATAGVAVLATTAYAAAASPFVALAIRAPLVRAGGRTAAGVGAGGTGGERARPGGRRG